MYEDLGDTIDDTTDKVKELKRQTLGFDQINNINENTGVEDLMLFLLQNNFIQNVHCLTGSSMACIKSIIYKIKENNKNGVESLQLRKTMIS